MKVFAELTAAEQTELRAAHEAGRTIEIFNANMGEWLVSYRPTFAADMAYRVAEQDAPAATDIKRG